MFIENEKEFEKLGEQKEQLMIKMKEVMLDKSRKVSLRKRMVENICQVGCLDEKYNDLL